MRRTARRALVGGSTVMWLAVTAVAGAAAPPGPATAAAAARAVPSPDVSPTAPAPARFDDVAASPASVLRAAAGTVPASPEARAAILPLFLTAALGVVLSLVSWERSIRGRRRPGRRRARHGA